MMMNTIPFLIPLLLISIIKLLNIRDNHRLLSTLADGDRHAVVAESDCADPSSMVIVINWTQRDSRVRRAKAERE